MLHAPYALVAFAALAVFASAAAPAAAEDRPLAEWKFRKGAGDTAAPWENVRIPHTWNATDSQKGGGSDHQSRTGYYRGPGTYAADLGPGSAFGGRRVFVRFEAVSTVADVFLDGRKLGAHLGGFTAFGFELTPHLSAAGPNRLEVRASNAWRGDVLPLSGDFSVCGGMYRPAWLIVRDDVCLNQVLDGTGGVTLRYGPASRERASVTVNAAVSNGGRVQVPVRLRCTLRDRDGAKVAETVRDLAAAPGDNAVSADVGLARPHLWNGVKDPYLYSLEVVVEAAGKAVDSLRFPVGFRDIRIDPAKGFFLNGEPCRLRGVCRHQDREGKGWALSAEDQAEDARIIAEMGANAVRLAHYPHSQTFLDECDRLGLLVWAELPLVDTVGSPMDPMLPENARGQLRELIRQQGRHPAVFCWSLFNELGNGKTEDPVAVVRDLNRTAHAEDPTRPTVGATCRENKALCAIPDVMAFNAYPGWYGGMPGSMEAFIAKYAKVAPEKAWGVSEYGAGASLKHHDPAVAKPPKTTGHWHPEEWQCRVHEQVCAIMDRHPGIWGTFLWNMFDFASVWRDEGDRPGVNDKGLVTFDRKARKDAFYFYQANWSSAPVLHILSRRDTPTKVGTAAVRLYANLKDLRVTVNGRDAGKLEQFADHAFVTPPMPLNPGENRIEAFGTAPDGATVRDSCVWTRE